MSLSNDELKRYARHLAIPDFGVDAQEQLKSARVLVVGAGGLGSPVLLYLAAAGVGKIGIVDPDVVDLSNLQRQVLYTSADTGRKKAELAGEKIKAINPHINVHTYPVRLTSANAMEIVAEYDIVADGTDNFPTRYLVNDVCVLLNKVNVYAAIFRFEGQVSVFNYLNTGQTRGPNYRDLFPDPPPPGLVPDCATGGVLGVLPGIIGSMQASEVIKIITGIGVPLAGRLFFFDAKDFTTRTLKIKKRSKLIINGLIDYDLFCGIKKDGEKEIQLIDNQEFRRLEASAEPFTLVDVREPYERAISKINGSISIPLSVLNDHINDLPSDHKVIIHCQSGQRSRKAIQLILAQRNLDNLYNLKGGLNNLSTS